MRHLLFFDSDQWCNFRNNYAQQLWTPFVGLNKAIVLLAKTSEITDKRTKDNDAVIAVCPCHLPGMHSLAPEVFNLCICSRAHSRAAKQNAIRLLRLFVTGQSGLAAKT